MAPIENRRKPSFKEVDEVIADVPDFIILPVILRNAKMNRRWIVLFYLFDLFDASDQRLKTYEHLVTGSLRLRLQALKQLCDGRKSLDNFAQRTQSL